MINKKRKEKEIMPMTKTIAKWSEEHLEEMRNKTKCPRCRRSGLTIENFTCKRGKVRSNCDVCRAGCLKSQKKCGYKPKNRYVKVEKKKKRISGRIITPVVMDILSKVDMNSLTDEEREYFSRMKKSYTKLSSRVSSLNSSNSSPSSSSSSSSLSSSSLASLPEGVSSSSLSSLSSSSGDISSTSCTVPSPP